MEELKVGDVVTLNSGGLKMTVHIIHPDGKVAVVWTENVGSGFSGLVSSPQQQYACFPREILKKSPQ